MKMKKRIVQMAACLGLALSAASVVQAVAPATAPVTTQPNILIDTRPNLVVRLTDLKIDTLTNPGTLILVK
jgi:hypothetical protein